jgi:hypothetical protein
LARAGTPSDGKSAAGSDTDSKGGAGTASGRSSTGAGTKPGDSEGCNSAALLACYADRDDGDGGVDGDPTTGPWTFAQ